MGRGLTLHLTTRLLEEAKHMFRRAIATVAVVLLTASFAGAAQQSGTGATTAKQGSAHSHAGKKKSTKHKKSTAKKHKKTTKTTSPRSASAR
jgi:hypothetical protein